MKGKKEGITIYTVLTEAFNYLKHENFLKYYKNREWDKANKLLTQLVEENPSLEFYSNMMLERVADLKINDPGKEWDKVYRATSK